MRELACDSDLLQFSGRLKALGLQCRAEVRLEGTSPAQSWLARGQEHDVLCHKGQQPRDIAVSGRVTPAPQNLSDLVFVRHAVRSRKGQMLTPEAAHVDGHDSFIAA
jgi:hypothetical protein